MDIYYNLKDKYSICNQKHVFCYPVFLLPGNLQYGYLHQKQQIEMISIKKRQPNKLGRPSQKKSSFTIKGIVKEPIQSEFDDVQENECLLAEAVLQIPLHLKCISNTIKQLDKNNTINFCLTPNSIFIYFSERSQENNCFIQLNCKQLLSYYFKNTNEGVIKFELPVNHLANTFNFYNRSSIKTELRIFGPFKPAMRLDSYRSEKKSVQRIANTINIRLQPGIEELKRVNDFSQGVFELSNCQTDLDRINAVMTNKKMFNDCFFFKYRDLKVYSFQILNQEIRKFITEVQKDSQRIYIVRQMELPRNQDGDRPKLKMITIKANIPGSSSVKKIEHPASQVNSYKQYKNDTEVEFTYSIGSDILKQICSTNPQSSLQFTMLSNGQIILKITNQVSIFKFQFNPTDSF